MRSSDYHRSFSNNIITALLAGLLLGLAAFFLKIVMSGEISREIIYSPVAWFTLLLAASGFLMMQSALQGYVSKIIPIITGNSILVSVVLASIFLGELISILKWIGILLVLIGVFGLVEVRGNAKIKKRKR